jgi:hypothetical protein
MSGWYLDGKEKLLQRVIPEEALFYVVGVNDAYEFDENHSLFTDFDEDVILEETALANVTMSGGVLKADNVTWLNAGLGIVDRSLILTGVVIYLKLDDTGTLLAYINSAYAGLPQNLVGVSVTSQWDSRGIFKL